MEPKLETANTAGDVGSLTLLGLALAGAFVTIAAYWVLGS